VEGPGGLSPSVPGQNQSAQQFIKTPTMRVSKQDGNSAQKKNQTDVDDEWQQLS